MEAGTVYEVTTGKAKVCRDILDDLPQWFGIPEAVDAYERAVDDLQMFAFGAPAAVGFVSIKLHNPFSAEVYLLGVKRAWHRKGVGISLLQHVERVLAEKQIVYLSVKTVAADRPNEAYAATRCFYEALNFLPLEVFPTLWGAENPCLLMIKQIQR